MHLSNQEIEDWRQLSDEAHIKALFNRPSPMNPRYMGYLERERPNVMTQYLKLWQANGNYMSPIAKRRLQRGF